MRFVVDFAWVAPDGLLWAGIPLQAHSEARPGVRSYKTAEAMETGTQGVLADLQLIFTKGRPVAVVYDKEENRHLLYTADGLAHEVPWNWGEWPPHIPLKEAS